MRHGQFNIYEEEADFRATVTRSLSDQFSFVHNSPNSQEWTATPKHPAAAKPPQNEHPRDMSNSSRRFSRR